MIQIDIYCQYERGGKDSEEVANVCINCAREKCRTEISNELEGVIEGIDVLFQYLLEA